MSDQTRARDYHRRQLRLRLLGLALTAVYLVAVLASGVARDLRDALAHLTPHWWLALPLMLAVLGGVYRLLTLPLAWLSGFWLPRRFGLLHQSLARWAWDAVKASLIGAVLGLAMAELVYLLLRTTAWWWLAGAAALLAGSALVTLVAPIWLVPLFYRLTPLADDGGLAARLERLAARAGAPVLGVWVADQSRRSRTANAAVTGLGRTRRVILFDTLVHEFTADEVESVLAHELGHHVHGDIWRGLLVQGGLTVAAFAGADLALRAGADALGLAGPGDLAGLPLLGLVLLGAGLVGLPVGNGWSRHVERQADAFALRTTGNPAAFIGAMERLGALNLAERDPHPLVELLLYSHPSLGRRIAHARLFLRPAG
ncbi:MAG: M48 family metalloprotease [Candidatus Rokubacteria bacterium]|nr:M48 family metalloprotease [Candidatus Rokubacteria bacterium]